MVEKTNKSEVAERIREVVTGCGRSRYALARAAGIEQSQLSRFMGGANMGLPGMEALAAVLGLKIVVEPLKPKEK